MGGARPTLRRETLQWSTVDAVGETIDLSLQQKLIHEGKAVGLATLYFGCWIAALVTLKHLILAEYHIEFHGFSKALVGVLILSKVVLVLERVSLGAWVRARPAWVDIILRTALYAGGVFLVLLAEKTIEGRHEYGGLGASLSAVFQHADSRHVLTNVVGLSGGLLGYNVLSVVRRHLGRGGLYRLFLTPIPTETFTNQPASIART
ncbi:hypothetical protein YTPLAS18_28670 [Nitrospira sp.]|nr:hypothetical protein YTPLAS18_28670 [Nitrospira sp.]